MNPSKLEANTTPPDAKTQCHKLKARPPACIVEIYPMYGRRYFKVT
jgi:hypothetical protein